MDTALEEFRENLKNAIKVEQHVAGFGQRMAFVHTLSRHCPYEQMDDLAVLYADGKCGSVRYAVDGWAFESEEHTLMLVLGDWNFFESEENLTKGDAEVLLKRLRMFFELSRAGKLPDKADPPLDFSSPEYQLAELIRDETIERVHLILFTDRPVSGRLKSLGCEPFGNISVEQDLWSIERLLEYVASKKDHEPLDISFEDHPVPLTPAVSGEGYKSYLGVISGEKLAHLYRDYGGRLLEKNVRSFLTLKSGVNKQIRRTIIGPHPENFFIYNNGIAATAEDLRFNAKGELIAAKDFQIINGGQTTASLARAFFVDKAAEAVANIQVAVKLTEIDETLPAEEARMLVANISRFSNNQNKVSDADLTSNHAFHILMEQMASRITAPPAPGRLHGMQWFYERNRGGYLQYQMFMTDAQRKACQLKTDSHHVIKKEDVARVHMIWEKQRPDIVSKGAAKLFAEFMDRIDADWDKKRYEGAYGDQYFKDTVSLFIIYHELRKAVMDADWYQAGGYLAAIVVYSVSVYSWLFSRQFPGAQFDFDPIWKSQDIPDLMLEDLLDIARTVQDCLTVQPRDKENVTEWAKLENCWKLVKKKFDDLKFTLNAFAEGAIRTAQDVREKKVEARQNAKVEMSVDILGSALQFKYWIDALNFNQGRGVLTDRQKTAIAKCSQLPGRVPSDRVMKTAFEGIEALRDEGFPH